MKQFILIGLSICLVSCTNQTDKKRSEGLIHDSLEKSSMPLSRQELAHQPLTTHDSIFSKSKIFISILPSDKYLDSIQKVVPEDEWDEVASDNEYYRDLTENFLLNKGYKLFNRPDHRFWYFKLLNGTTQRIDTLSLHDKWGNLIFNGKDSAFIFDSASPEMELKDKI